MNSQSIPSFLHLFAIKTLSLFPTGPFSDKSALLWLLKTNYKMGCGRSKHSGELSKHQLYIGTLNYCAIMNSPFEFYCQDLQKELIQISGIFASLIPQYVPNFNQQSFKWGMGKIDVKVRAERYSPLFSLQVGIEDGHFVTRERFGQLWDQRFDEHVGGSQQQFKRQERETAKLYDFIAFHTLLVFVYKQRNYQQLITQNIKTYLEKLRPFFELSFLDQKRKLDKVIANFKTMNIDIFFLQEYSQYFEKYIDSTNEYVKATDKTKDTMIIARKSSFTELKSIETVLSAAQIESLNWAGRTAILCVDSLILISAHLTSKAEKNKPQIDKLKSSLIKLKQQMPLHDIILGGDLNSFLAPNEEFNQFFEMFPAQESLLTTVKKRTMTQAQYHKGNKMIQESKDKLITTLKLKDCRILYIDSTEPKKEDVVPKDDHPFDHFVVVATVSK